MTKDLVRILTEVNGAIRGSDDFSLERQAFGGVPVRTTITIRNHTLPEITSALLQLVALKLDTPDLYPVAAVNYIVNQEHSRYRNSENDVFMLVKVVFSFIPPNCTFLFTGRNASGALRRIARKYNGEDIFSIFLKRMDFNLQQLKSIMLYLHDIVILLARFHGIDSEITDYLMFEFKHRTSLDSYESACGLGVLNALKRENMALIHFFRDCLRNVRPAPARNGVERSYRETCLHIFSAETTISVGERVLEAVLHQNHYFDRYFLQELLREVCKLPRVREHLFAALQTSDLTALKKNEPERWPTVLDPVYQALNDAAYVNHVLTTLNSGTESLALTNADVLLRACSLPAFCLRLVRERQRYKHIWKVLTETHFRHSLTLSMILLMNCAQKVNAAVSKQTMNGLVYSDAVVNAVRRAPPRTVLILLDVLKSSIEPEPRRSILHLKIEIVNRIVELKRKGDIRYAVGLSAMLEEMAHLASPSSKETYIDLNDIKSLQTFPEPVEGIVRDYVHFTQT